MPPGTKPTILLIETDTSLRRLIALGLQYRGMRVIESSVSSLLDRANSAIEHLPDLLVIDVDGGTQSDWSLLAEIKSLPNFSAIPIITLAWEVPVLAGMPEAVEDNEITWNLERDECDGRVTFLTKPFDARALYAAIEQLLVAHPTNATMRAQERAVSGRATAMSIWPLLTAAGLLLAFIGLMGELPLIIIGLLIGIISLLWWTLGSKPERAAHPVRVERSYPAPTL